MVNAPTGGFTVGTMRFNGTGIGLTTATGTNVVTTGGILVTPGSSGTISGAGTLTSGATAKEMVIIDNGTLNIGTVIANNGANVVAVTAAGTGVTTFSGANTFTGATVLTNGSTLVVSNAGSTTNGSTNNGLSSSAVTIGTGATLALRNDGLGGTGTGTITYGNTFSVNGFVHG